MTGISLTLSESSDTTEPVLCLLAAGPVSANGSGDHWAMDQWGHGAGSRDQASCTASCTARVHEAVLTIVNNMSVFSVDRHQQCAYNKHFHYHHGHLLRAQDPRCNKSLTKYFFDGLLNEIEATKIDLFVLFTAQIFFESCYSYLFLQVIFNP